MEILSDPTPDMLAMPRFDDGAIDIQELLERLAEQVVNAVMYAEAGSLPIGLYTIFLDTTEAGWLSSEMTLPMETMTRISKVLPFLICCFFVILSMQCN